MTAFAVHDQPSLTVSLGEPRLVAEIIDSTEALLSGHFGLLGGLHSDRFIRFSRVASHTPALDAITRWLLPTAAAWMADVVVAPVTAGVALGASLAKRLGLPLALVDVDDEGRARAVLAPEEIESRQVLLVNDVVTTGERMAALAAVVADAGGRVSGGCWFLSRAEIDVNAMINAPTAAIGTLLLPQWAADACPLCSDDQPMTFAAEIN